MYEHTGYELICRSVFYNIIGNTCSTVFNIYQTEKTYTHEIVELFQKLKVTCFCQTNK